MIYFINMLEWVMSKCMWEYSTNTKMLYGFKFSKYEYIRSTYYTNHFAMNSEMSEKKPLTSRDSSASGRGRHTEK